MKIRYSGFIFAVIIMMAQFVFSQALYSADADYARWAKTDMPLKVYIERNTNVPGYKETYAIEVAKALRKWKDASGQTIDFTIVPSASQADMVIRFSDKLKKTDYINQPSSQGHKYIWGITKLGYPTEIIVSTKHPMNSTENLSENVIYMITLHEIGHGLGLFWHTKDPHDIMYPDFIVPASSSKGARIVVNQNQGSLSTRDISNLKALYNNNDVKILSKVPKGVKVALGSPKEGRIGDIETTGAAAASVKSLSMKSDVDLGKALAYLKENPNSYEAHNNIGLVYMQNNDYNNALQYFNKALSINPTYAVGYFNRALIYSKLNENLLAVDDFEKYLKLKPDAENAGVVESEIARLKK